MKIKYELEFDFTNEIHQKIAEEVEYLSRRFRNSKFIEYDCQVLEVAIEKLLEKTYQTKKLKLLWNNMIK